MLRSALLGTAIAVATVLVLLLGSEFALRLYYHKVFSFESLLERHDRTENPRAKYDAELGWEPEKGNGQVIEDAGFRSNGPLSLNLRGELNGSAVLAVGDSFTFGDEVLDHESWPAQLETIAGRPVLNAGVFAYGVDQAYLRASRYLETYDVDFVLLAFISDDIDRAEFSHYGAWKPYFQYVDDDLVRMNSPVPQTDAPQPPLRLLREVFGYSYFARAGLRRVMPGWWDYGRTEQKHSDGERVTVELFRRLDQLSKSKGARFVAITFSTNGRIGDDDRLLAVVDQANQLGIDVLDLAPIIAELRESGREDMYRERGHFTVSMNEWVATQIALHLDDLEAGAGSTN